MEYIIVVISLPTFLLLILAYFLKKIFPEMKIKDLIEYVKHSKKININVSLFREKENKEQ